MAQQTTADGEAQTDAEYQVVAIAVQPKGSKVYVYRGPNETEYPVKFDRVGSEIGILTVDNPAHRLTQELNGVRFHTCEVGTERAEELERVIEEVKHTDDDLVEILDRALDRIPDDL